MQTSPMQTRRGSSDDVLFAIIKNRHLKNDWSGESGVYRGRGRTPCLNGGYQPAKVEVIRTDPSCLVREPSRLKIGDSETSIELAASLQALSMAESSVFFVRVDMVA